MSCWISDTTQITNLLSAVDDFDATIWTEDKILELAEEVVQPYLQEVLLGRKFDLTAYTDILDGNGDHDIRLKHYPIGEVTSVKIDDDEQDLDDVYVYTSSIAIDGVFPVGKQNITVEYTAGHSTIDSSLILAVYLLCAVYIARVVGTGGGATSTGITAGPIGLREAFSAEGKYADKIKEWKDQIDKIVKHFAGFKIISKRTKKNPSYNYYDPRTDSYIG